MVGSDRADNALKQFVDRLERGEIDDGLPLVKPTTERVDTMLSCTPRAADNVIAEFGEDTAVTVRNLATYAVMAGCTPIHMPLIIAAATALRDAVDELPPLTDPGSWAFQWIVNGPIRGDLDIRTDTGAFGPGFRANRTIGRALGLALREAVFGEDAMSGSIGNPMKLALVAGENEERSPWEPYHVSQGYDPDQSTVTVSIRRNFIQFIPYEINPEGVLRAMAYNTVPSIYGGEHEDHAEAVIHTVAPYNADELAEAGMTKGDVKAYLARNSVRSQDEIASSLPDKLNAANPRDLQYSQIDSPEHIQLYVLGGSGRWNAVGHSVTPSVTATVNLPSGWENLLAEYRIERAWGGITEQYDTSQDWLEAPE